MIPIFSTIFSTIFSIGWLVVFCYIVYRMIKPLTKTPIWARVILCVWLLPFIYINLSYIFMVINSTKSTPLPSLTKFHLLMIYKWIGGHTRSFGSAKLNDILMNEPWGLHFAETGLAGWGEWPEGGIESARQRAAGFK